MAVDKCVKGVLGGGHGRSSRNMAVEHYDRQAKSFTAAALAFDQDASVFASCKGRLNEYGVGVWDRATGEQADFFYEPPAAPWTTRTGCSGWTPPAAQGGQLFHRPAGLPGQGRGVVLV